MTELPELLNTDQAARYVNMSRQAMSDMRHRGQGPRYSKLSARAVRYRRSDLDEWIESKSTGGAPMMPR
jgi:predicted DNA-binding transcriptional regulator AlpA